MSAPTAVPSGSCRYSPDGVPAKVMVTDLYHTGETTVKQHCVDQRPADAFFEYLPDPCNRGLGLQATSIASRRAVEVVFDENVPKNDPSQYRHTVTVYDSGDSASAYVSSVRAAVRECPVRKVTGATWTYAILSSTAGRLDLSVRRTADKGGAGQGVPPVATFRVSIAHSGAHVGVLTDVGWEGYPSADKARDALFKAAADQLERWG
jgi:hypothetical protein